MVSPGLSSTPANSEPIMMVLAPAAMALVMSPEYLMPPSAMSGMSRFAGGAISVGDSGDLRHADSGDHAGGADGAGADADLDCVRSGVDQSERAFVGGDVSGEQIDVGKGLFHVADGLQHARRVAVGGVDREHIDVLGDQRGGAFQIVAGCAEGRADAEAALFVFGGVGVFQFLLDVFDGDQAFEFVVAVDDQQLLDAMLVQDELGFFKGGADGDGDEVFFGHHVADRECRCGSQSAGRDW